MQRRAMRAPAHGRPFGSGAQHTGCSKRVHGDLHHHRPRLARRAWRFVQAKSRVDFLRPTDAEDLHVDGLAHGIEHVDVIHAHAVHLRNVDHAGDLTLDQRHQQAVEIVLLSTLMVDHRAGVGPSHLEGLKRIHSL